MRRAELTVRHRHAREVKADDAVDDEGPQLGPPQRRGVGSEVQRARERNVRLVVDLLRIRVLHLRARRG